MEVEMNMLWIGYGVCGVIRGVCDGFVCGIDEEGRGG